MNQTVPLPRRMREMQRDRRGYPVPYIVLRDKRGQPHFAINDITRQRECLNRLRCPICGKRLEKTFWFAGGPVSAFHAMGAYIDSAMHEECMVYALQVCPYLAMPTYLGRVDNKTLDPKLCPKDIIGFEDPTMIPERPDVFVCILTSGFTVYDRGPHRHIAPERPYLDVQFWRNGVEISREEGMQRGRLRYSYSGMIELDRTSSIEAARKAALKW